MTEKPLTLLRNVLVTYLKLISQLSLEKRIFSDHLEIARDTLGF